MQQVIFYSPTPGVAEADTCVKRLVECLQATAEASFAEVGAAPVSRWVQATNYCITGRQIAADNHWTKCHRLRPSDRAAHLRDAPVEEAGGSALSSVQERIRRSGDRGLERACARAGGDRALEHTVAGKRRPLTRFRRIEKSSKSSSSCSRRHREGARGRTLRPAQRERNGRTSPDTRISIYDRLGWKGR